MKQVSLTQGTPEWLQWRANKFGASDAPAMMGCSSYRSRTQLLDEKKTGITPEVDAATQRRFDEGHRIEELARPLAEKIVGEDLYPISGKKEGTNLAASFDGLTLMEDVAWECKSSNQRLRDAMPHEVCDDSYGAQLPEEYRVQMAHQQIVSGATRTLFTAARFDAGGKPVDVRHCWYEAEPELQQRIIAGWKQFAEDLEAHEPAPKAAPVVATPQESLPAVSVRVDGALQITDNLDLFGQALRSFVDTIPQQPETDQHFADCEAACKTLKKAEDALAAAEDNALAQISDVEQMRRAVADLRNLARDTRLATEKLVRAEKENRRRQLVVDAQAEIDKYVDGLNAQLERPWVERAYVPFGDAIKGLKSLDSMTDKISVALADAKGQAHELAQAYERNRDALKTDEQDWIMLFADFRDVGAKAAEDFDALMQLRITQHKQAEVERLEAERARIRAEEERRAQAAAEAERQRIAAEERAKAQAEREAEEERRRILEEAAKPAVTRALESIEQDAPGKPVASIPAVPAAGVTARAVGTGAAADNKPTLNLSAINARLAPLSISAAGLAEFGIEPLATDKSARLYSEAQFETLRTKLIEHLSRVAATEHQQEKEAA